MPGEDIEDFKATPLKLKEGRSIINDPNIPSNHKYPKSDKRMDTLRMMYKVGFGPSSSHTMGPRFAAERFFNETPGASSYVCTLYGSLAQTGRGHLTDSAIADVLKGCTFNWMPTKELPRHTNGMVLEAYDAEKNLILKRVYYSVGGGALQDGDLKDLDRIKCVGAVSIETAIITSHMTDTDEKSGIPTAEKSSPYQNFPHFSDIKKWCFANDKTLYEFVYQFDEPTIKDHLAYCWNAMKEAVERGIKKSHPVEASGHLKYPRKAFAYLAKAEQIGRSPTQDRQIVLRKKFLNLAYTLAVSEENGSASGNVVTAPTCGACGIVPGCMYYFYSEYKVPDNVILDALAVGGIIGNIAKCNGSISGAEAGCQAEVGVATAMAAAAICHILDYIDVRNGKDPMSKKDIVLCEEVAAVGALQHALGLTCDPVLGLVVEPCIERNGAYALRAHYAATMSMSNAHDELLSWDEIVHTMVVTGHDLPFELRESAQGGLAHFYCLDDVTDGATIRSTSTPGELLTM